MHARIVDRLLLALCAFLLACGGEAFESPASEDASTGDRTIVGTGGATGSGGAPGVGGGGVSGMGGGETGGSIVGEADASIIDGEPAPGEAAPTFDAAPADAAPMRDATGPETSTGGPHFCDVTPHTFCCDFDEPNVLDSQWDAKFLYGGGQLAISTLTSTSHPQSLYVQSVVSQSGSSSEAMLHKNFPMGATSHAHIGFNVFAEDFAAGGSSNAVTWTNGNANVTFSIQAGSDVIGCRLVLFGSAIAGGAVDCPAKFARRTWTHFDIDLNYSAQGIGVQLSMPGNAAAGNFPATGWLGKGVLEIGSYPGSPQGFWYGYFDSVVVDLQ